MNPLTVYYSIWAIFVVSAFITFITFAQQGKASGKNTWWFNHKVILGLLFLTIFLACGLFLKFA